MGMAIYVRRVCDMTVDSYVEELSENKPEEESGYWQDGYGVYVRGKCEMEIMEQRTKRSE